MVRGRSDQGWRAASFAAALLAITLNFLQPLVHAALMRDGGPGTSGLWAAMCLPNAGSEQQDSAPAGKLHECCLGLAHAQNLSAPSTSFVQVARIAAAVHPLDAARPFTPVGIRAGPNQPRAPPTHG
jgi:hypothetical protein